MPDQQTVTQVSLSATPEIADDIIEKYFEMGWTDGLPVVPPTKEKINLFVAALGGDRAFLECKVPPRWGGLTR